MKYLLALFLMPICLFASVKVAILGDSITCGGGATPGNGYVDVLRERYAEEGKDVELIVRAYGGAMTDTALQITVSLITQEKPDYIVYFLGINDCTVANYHSWTPDQLKRSLIHNLGMAMNKAHSNCKKIIIGGVNCPHNPSYNSSLSETYSILINCYQAHPCMLLGQEVLAHCPDTIHPNDTGMKIISDSLYEALQIVGAY